MQLYCSSWPTVGYHCFRYKFHDIFLAFPLLFFSSSGQQLCLPISSVYPIALSTHQNRRVPVMSRFESSVLPKNIQQYPFGSNIILLWSVHLFIYWLILLLLQFFPSWCPFALNFPSLLFSNLSIFLPLFSLFHVPYFHSVFVYFIFPVFPLLLAFFITFGLHYLFLYLYVSIFMLSITCFETSSFLYFPISRGMYRQPYYTNYSCSL